MIIEKDFTFQAHQKLVESLFVYTGVIVLSELVFYRTYKNNGRIVS